MTCRGCEAHYTSCVCERPYKGAYGLGVPCRVLDVLEIEGCWMSSLELVNRTGANYETVGRALTRLHKRGLLEVRQVERVGAVFRGEWRLAG